jgi:hypothetical protein
MAAEVPNLSTEIHQSPPDWQSNWQSGQFLDHRDGLTVPAQFLARVPAKMATTVLLADGTKSRSEIDCGRSLSPGRRGNAQMPSDGL